MEVFLEIARVKQKLSGDSQLWFVNGKKIRAVEITACCHQKLIIKLMQLKLSHLVLFA